MIMDYNKIQDMSEKELKEKLTDLQNELNDLRTVKAGFNTLRGNGNGNGRTGDFKKIKKDIARIKTEMNDRGIPA